MPIWDWLRFVYDVGTTMDCHGCEDLILLYALDDLEGPELQDVRAHLQTGCPVCHGRLAEAQAMLALLPTALPVARVPPPARRRLLDRIGGQTTGAGTLQGQAPVPGRAPAASMAGGSMKRRSQPTLSFMWLLPAAAGAALAAGVALLIGFNLVSTFKTTIDKLQSQVANGDGEIRQLHSTLAGTRETLRLIQSPGMQVARLDGLGAQPKARAGLIWDPIHKVVFFHAEDLRNLQEGRAYELWLIDSNGKPIPAGTFSVDNSGHGSIANILANQHDPLQLLACAVSEEVAGGVLSPTAGNILLKGRMDKRVE
jgi:hypothetical protein